jgi:hypothetical protein
MTQTIVINIAGMRVALLIADEVMAAKTCEKYGDFLSPDGAAPTTVRVDVIPGARFIAMGDGAWVIETALEGERLSYRSYEESGWVDFESGVGGLELAPTAEVENFLRVLYAHLCARSGALLLHAAGIVREEHGYVFFGPSGSGKSTCALLSRGAVREVLSDDLVIIRKAGADLRVYGTPFHGTAMEMPRTRADAPLRGAYLLVKDSNHFLVPMDVARAVAALTRSAPFVMSAPASGRSVIEVCIEIAHAAAVAELHFRKDDGFWKVIDESRKPISRTS